MPKSKSRRSRKGRDAQSHVLPRALIQAWRGTDAERELDMFDKVFRQRDPEAILNVAIAMLTAADRTDFITDMFDIAGTVFPTLRLENGTDIDARLQLFTVPLHGIAQELPAMFEPKVFNAIAQQVRASGYAHDQSNVILAPVALDAISVAMASPFQIRRVANAMLQTLMGKATSPMPTINQLCAHEASASAHTDGDTAVTRLLMGARLIFDENGDRHDLFDPADYHPGDSDDQYDEAFERHEAARTEAGERFADAANAILEKHAIDLIVDGPTEWIDGLSAMAQHRLFGSLHLMAAVSGISVDDADTAHITIDENALHVALSVRGTLVGPVDVPLPLMDYCWEAIVDWLNETFEKVVEYEDVAMLMAAHPVTHH